MEVLGATCSGTADHQCHGMQDGDLHCLGGQPICAQVLSGIVFRSDGRLSYLYRGGIPIGGTRFVDFNRG